MATIQFETKEQNDKFIEYLEKGWIGYECIDDESLVLDFYTIQPCYRDNVKSRVYHYKGKIINYT